MSYRHKIINVIEVNKYEQIRQKEIQNKLIILT